MTPLQQKIMSFYANNKRDLPWRKTTNRYHILVSEVMLQQTQVDRVIPKYKLWVERFPTIQDLATATLTDVLQLWSGLGYNSRGKRLHDTAKKIIEKFKGTVPDTVSELLTLPGIGPYTARSILIFADNKDIATVDTNIRRILIHELDLDEKTSDKELFRIAKDLVPKGRSCDWHNALMDYGATILTARKSGIKPKTKQTRFEGSKRQYRAKIVNYLTKHSSLTATQAKELWADSPYDLSAIMNELAAEGLLEQDKKSYWIKS